MLANEKQHHGLDVYTQRLSCVFALLSAGLCLLNTRTCNGLSFHSKKGYGDILVILTLGQSMRDSKRSLCGKLEQIKLDGGMLLNSFH